MKNQLFLLLAFTLSLGLAAQPAAPVPENYALFFAVEQYQNALIKGPNGAIQDARSIAAVLASSYGVQVEVVENPTTQQIMGKLAAYREQFAQGQLPKSGQLLIYFIGQGAQEGAGGSFLPADALIGQPDASGYSWISRLKEIAKLECREVLVVADAEYSSTIGQVLGSGGRTPPPFSPERMKDWRHSAGKPEKRSWVMLALDARAYRDASGQSLSQNFLKRLIWLAEEHSPVNLENIQRAKGSSQWASAFLFSYGGGNYGSNYDLAFRAVEHKPSFRGARSILPRRNFENKSTQEIEGAIWQLVQQQNNVVALSFYCQAYPEGRYIEEARTRMYTFPDTLKTADGRIWQPRPLPQKGADGFVLVRVGTTEWGYGGRSPRDNRSTTTNTLRDFYLSSREVTNADFDQFCIDTGMRPYAGTDWSRQDHPAANVSWYEALEYCNWLSRKRGLEPVYDIVKEKKDTNNLNHSDTLKWAVTAHRWATGYRLPTIAEWEHVYDLQHRSASYGELGQYGMGEKVLEWCWNWDYPYVPEKAASTYGPEAGAFRALRGCKKDDVSYRQPCAGRFSEMPGRKRSDVGFRVVRNGW